MAMMMSLTRMAMMKAMMSIYHHCSRSRKLMITVTMKMMIFVPLQQTKSVSGRDVPDAWNVSHWNASIEVTSVTHSGTELWSPALEVRVSN